MAINSFFVALALYFLSVLTLCFLAFFFGAFQAIVKMGKIIEEVVINILAFLVYFLGILPFFEIPRACYLFAKGEKREAKDVFRPLFGMFEWFGQAIQKKF